MSLQPSQFTAFFQELYPYPPMSWQVELTEAACQGDWPGYLCLPTGAGKTSAIDIALFALACQSNLPPEERTAAMRTFLVVDRRTVVSEAFCRAKHLQQQLADAQDGVLKTVADCLRSYTGGCSDPVSVVELRGGVYRDPGWCHSATQPMIITSTVDQVGSRLLFRGYGVSRSSRPVQAAAVAHDSLIILDEAHISAAFSQTLHSVRRFQGQPWSSQQVPLPMRVVEMTATPPEGSESSRLEIDPAELADPKTHIGNIVRTRKLATLEVAEKVKGAKAPTQLAKLLVEKAIESLQSNSVTSESAGAENSSADRSETNGEVDSQVASQPKVIGIMCNMVATAKATYESLLKEKTVSNDQVHLIIGAMRPCDRDQQTNQLRGLISTGSDRDQIDEPVFVVATQCIEVGADYDFDVLVTEAAPLSSLVQRFGRLNRAGRPIEAIAHIVMRGDRVRTKKQLDDDDKSFNFIDPIYGNAMSRTWNWLRKTASENQLDFGIAALKKLSDEIPLNDREQMSTDQSNSPVLMPGHLDLLCQTSIDPWPDPDVSLWLHGPQRIDPEVQVCWRADLVAVEKRSNADQDYVEIAPPKLYDDPPGAIHTISLCPPTSYECLSAPLRRVIAWLGAETKHKKTPADLSADVPSISDDSDTRSEWLPEHLRPVAWRGLEKSVVISKATEIRPGDTLVFPAASGGWTELGFIPEVNDWLPETPEGTTLPEACREAAQSPRGSKAIQCKANDFQKLAKIDCGNIAFSQSRNRPIVRLHPALIETPATRKLYQDLNPEFKITKIELKKLIETLPEDVAGGFQETSPSQIRYEFYSAENDRVAGIVLTGPKNPGWIMVPVPDDDGTDIYSQIASGKPVELSEHLAHVHKELEDSLKQLPLASFRRTLTRAAETHDWGKADARFQALLLGGDLYAALWEDKLYAKSASVPSNLAERASARKRSELPASFRHELLSVSLVEKSNGDTESKVEDRDLLLHLIATHHGHARPWAPVCDDSEPVDVSLENIGLAKVRLFESDRRAICYHGVDSPLISRFWKIIRKYGWWEAACLESLLRFADRRASQIESQKQSVSNPSDKSHSIETGAAS